MQREEAPARGSRSTVSFPLPPRLLGIAGVQPLELEVAEVADLGPRMRRLRLAGEALGDFTYRAGQDVLLVLGGSIEQPLCRRYSIRSLDRRARLLELDIVVHGVHGPGAAWAATVQPGDRVDGVGPRGKIFLNPDANWHLFLGDESAAPASLNMLEALPPQVPGVAYLEVPSALDELEADSGGEHQVRWLYRGDSPATASTLLEESLEGARLPAGRGHVYIFGEVQRVAAMRRAALARGLAPEQVSAKAYWGRARPNADRGEPD